MSRRWGKGTALFFNMCLKVRICFKHLKTEKILFFFSKDCYFQISQVSPACPSDNSSINMKMSIGHWRIETDKGNQKY